MVSCLSPFSIDNQHPFFTCDEEYSDNTSSHHNDYSIESPTLKRTSIFIAFNTSDNSMSQEPAHYMESHAGMCTASTTGEDFTMVRLDTPKETSTTDTKVDRSRENVTISKSNVDIDLDGNGGLEEYEAILSVRLSSCKDISTHSQVQTEDTFSSSPTSTICRPNDSILVDFDIISSSSTTVGSDLTLEVDLGEFQIKNNSIKISDDENIQDSKEYNSCDEIENTQTVKKRVSPMKNRRTTNRRHRNEKSQNKKWKRVNAEDIGFHLSSFPRLPATSDETNPYDDAHSTSVSSDGNLENISSATIDNNGSDPDSDDSSGPCDFDQSDERKEVCDEELDLDDETFFAKRGVDVKDSGEDEYDDYLWQWDSVHFGNSSVLQFSKRTSRIAFETPRQSLPVGKEKHKKQSVTILTQHVDYQIRNRYVCNMSKHDIGILFDFGCISCSKAYLRPDRHRRGMKSHIAVKSKHANVTDLFHNPSKKNLYMHHRLIKLLNIDVNFLYNYRNDKQLPSPMSKRNIDKEWIKGIRLNQPKSTAVTRSSTRKPQNLNHVLHETNMPGDFELDLVSFLLSIQNREMTPEDYEMLLRLDDSVQAKTVSRNILDSLRRETIKEEDLIDASLCTICMEPYVAGEVRTFLPCEHAFHRDCIDNWLNNSSQNCPLDGLPVSDS